MRSRAPCHCSADKCARDFSARWSAFLPKPEDTGGFEGYAGCVCCDQAGPYRAEYLKKIGKEQSTSLPLSELSRKESPFFSARLRHLLSCNPCRAGRFLCIGCRAVERTLHRVHVGIARLDVTGKTRAAHGLRRHGSSVSWLRNHWSPPRHKRGNSDIVPKECS